MWESLRHIEHDATVTPAGNVPHAVARVSHLPSQLSLAWAHVHCELSSASLATVLARATVSRGTVRVAVPHAPNLSVDEYHAAIASVTRTLAPPGGHVVWEQLPHSAWVGVPSSVADNLSRGLQRTFDPQSRCNSGILGAPFVA